MKWLLTICVVLILTGCDNNVQDAYNKMCDRDHDSVMCSNQEINDVDLGRNYIYSTRSELYMNFTYMYDSEQYNIEDYWTHNDTISEKLVGDCEDIAMTFISQLILDGFSADKIKLMISGEGGEVKHAYTKVTFEDGNEYNFYRHSHFEDMMYMRLDNVGSFRNVE